MRVAQDRVQMYALVIAE